MKEKKSSVIKRLLKYSLMGIGGLFVLMIIIGAFSGTSGDRTGTGQSNREPTCKTVTENIVNGIITVKAGSHQSYRFTISAATVNVKGNFLASGGGGNDIAVYILDSNSYINWQNGHEISAYYSSGKLTTGNIDITLPTGTYYLVYDNRFSVLTPKDIQTDISYSYQLCLQT